MRDMEIDLTNPAKPILWVRGQAIERYHWGKVKPYNLMTDVGFWGSKKEKAVDFYRKYGATAKNCADFLNKGLIKMSVGAVKGHEPLCYIRGKFSSERTIAVCEMKDDLDQAVVDGIKNITPFIAVYKKNPKELKKLLGSSNWKSICKNTFSRNKGIVDTLGARRFDNEYIEMLLKMRSSLFKRSYACGIETAHYLNNKCGISIKSISEKTNDVFNKSRLVADTRRMAEMYQQKFSFDWSWRKMKEKHEEFSKTAWYQEAERLKKENEKYGKPLREGKQKVWQLEDVKATFIDTYLGILEEGSKMHHCVGSYARACYENKYAVLHLEGDGEETTLGVYISSVDEHYSIQQHYGFMNATVKSEIHKQLADIVVAHLNTEAYDEKLYDLQHPVILGVCN